MWGWLVHKHHITAVRWVSFSRFPLSNICTCLLGCLYTNNIYIYLRTHKGPIKELRETPSKKHQKFVEFFDVRDAAKALKEMNGKEIHGKPVVIEFSRPGGHSRKLINAAATTTTSSSHQKYHSPPLPPPPLPRKFSVRSSFHNNFNNIAPRSHASQPQFPVRKSTGNKIVTTSGSLSSVERKMASASLCNGNEEKNTKRFSRKNQSSIAFASPAAAPSSPLTQQQQQPVPRNIKARKSKHGKKFDSRFLISEEASTESNCRDTRTTVMIKNIPNKYRFGRRLLSSSFP